MFSLEKEQLLAQQPTLCSIKYSQGPFSDVVCPKNRGFLMQPYVALTVTQELKTIRL